MLHDPLFSSYPNNTIRLQLSQTPLTAALPAIAATQYQVRLRSCSIPQQETALTDYGLFIALSFLQAANQRGRLHSRATKADSMGAWLCLHQPLCCVRLASQLPLMSCPPCRMCLKWVDRVAQLGHVPGAQHVAVVRVSVGQVQHEHRLSKGTNRTPQSGQLASAAHFERYHQLEI